MDVFILEPITQELAGNVIKQVHEAEGEDIKAHIMTYGGDILAGNAIASVLRDSKSHVTTNVVGVAASMGAVISQAGDNRLIAEDAHFNIHNGGQANVGRGTKEDHIEAAETLAKLDDVMIGHLGKSGLDRDTLKSIMKLDKLLSAEEAITLGFFDGTSTPIAATAELTKHTEMNKLSELMAQVDTAAIKMGLKEAVVEDDAKKELVAALVAEHQGAVDQVIEELPTDEEATGADILGSEMVPRAEFEMFKAEFMALIQPLLGAVETLPTPEQTTEVVEEVTTAKIDAVLKAIKSKTTLPVAEQNFEQPQEDAKEDWAVYDARKKEIKDNNKR
jgi:ATP-dependent protease ClpP protease subunit